MCVCVCKFVDHMLYYSNIKKYEQFTLELNMVLNIAENIIYIHNIIQWSIRIAQRAAIHHFYSI